MRNSVTGHDRWGEKEPYSCTNWQTESRGMPYMLRHLKEKGFEDDRARTLSHQIVLTINKTSPGAVQQKR